MTSTETLSSRGEHAKRPIPACAGIGLRAQHYQEVLHTRPRVGWFEVHSENYFGDGGRPLYYLEKIAEHYPVSFHGVGLSIGSTDPLAREHLNRLKSLVKRFEPGLVSEHLSWGSVGGRHFNDLFPMPYTRDALEHMISRVSQVQDFLGRQILIENVSSYLEFEMSDMPEWTFISELADRSGCGILLDVNNIYVNASNHHFNALTFLDAVNPDHVGEIHLAGHTVRQLEDGQILIDTHDQRVCQDVWSLYREAVKRFPGTPALIEWDASIPALQVLLDEASCADRIVSSVRDSRKQDNEKHQLIA